MWTAWKKKITVTNGTYLAKFPVAVRFLYRFGSWAWMLLARAEVFRACDCYPLLSICTPCCVLVRVVAQSLKSVKLLATSKRTQQLPKLLGQQCWELLRPSARSLRKVVQHSRSELHSRISRNHVVYTWIADVENHIIHIHQLRQDCKEMRSACSLKIYVFAYCT